MPKDGAARAKTLDWLMFQMGSIGPMFGQLYHFTNSAPEQIPYAVNRYGEETKRILGIMNKRLSEVDYLAGDYSIADIASYAWVKALSARFEELGLGVSETENVNRWLARVGGRDAVAKGMEILAI